MLDQEATDPEVERIALALRRPVDFGPEVDRAVMAAIHAAPLMVRPGTTMVAAPNARRGVWSWLVRPRPVRFSMPPLGALAAAGIAIAAILLRRDVGERRNNEQRQLTGEFPIPATGEFPAVSRAKDTVYLTRFVFVNPTAREVAVVGEFNRWDKSATKLRQVSNDGVWAVELKLEPGRYKYAFLVDGKEWVADPTAPTAIGDDFGQPNSVVTVQKAMSS